MSAEQLTNNKKEIDGGDKDYLNVLNTFSQMFETEEETHSLNDLERIAIKKEQNNPKTFACNTEISNDSFIDWNLSIQEHMPFLEATYKNLPESSSTCKKGERQEIFPIKLYKLLEKSDICGYSSIISWLPHGCAFKIHDEKLFKQYFMKKYLLQTKYESFKRQLYVYGFKKVGVRFTDAGAYYHDKFVSGQFDMCSEMTRTKKSSNPITQNYDFSAIPTSLNNYNNYMNVASHNNETAKTPIQPQKRQQLMSKNNEF